jgi:hypothetical protein
LPPTGAEREPGLAPAATPLRFVLLELLMRPIGPWQVRVPILVLAGLGLLDRRILLAPWTWFGLAALTGLRVVLDWPLPDNHAYLLSYTCLAIGLASVAPLPAPTLARASRWLIGLAFALAVLWKAFLAPEYVDGRFFRVTLMTDDRFAHATMFFGGIDQAQLETNREALAGLPEGAELLDPPQLVEPNRFKVFAWLATWGTLVLEGAVALAFLLPVAGWLRHVSLLGFVALTYAFAPVAGFGWLLLALGLTMCGSNERAFRIAYVTLFFVVLVHAEISWIAILLSLRS